MTERRKLVPESEIKKLRFPDTPERLRLRQFNSYSTRLGNLRNGVSQYQEYYEYYDKVDPPTFPDEETQAKLAELTQVIQSGNNQIKDTPSPAVQRAIEIANDEREKLKPSVMAQVRITRSEHEIILGWANSTEVDLELLFDNEGYPSPDPHIDAEESYVWGVGLLNHTTAFGKNFVRSHQIHFFDPDINIAFSNDGGVNDIKVKSFELALGMTPEMLSFIEGHLGYQNMEDLKGAHTQDSKVQTLRSAFKLLYDSSVKLEDGLPPFNNVYRDDF